ncbi:MAG: hypothetical protein RIM99_10390 [Cyclobacteriaceae bacterium]
MKHALILILVALITITIILMIYRPDLLEDVWLWIVGLIGPIIGFVKEGIRAVNRFFKSLDDA